MWKRAPFIWRTNHSGDALFIILFSALATMLGVCGCGNAPLSFGGSSNHSEFTGFFYSPRCFGSRGHYNMQRAWSFFIIIVTTLTVLDYSELFCVDTWCAGLFGSGCNAWALWCHAMLLVRLASLAGLLLITRVKLGACPPNITSTC